MKGFLIKRFIKDRTERSPIISIFGVLGVLLGVFAIIVVISVMQGFETDMVKRIIGSQPHIYITDTETPMAFEDWSETLKKLTDSKNLKNHIVSPFVEAETILYYNNTTIGAVVFSVSNEMLIKIGIETPGKRKVMVGEQLGFSAGIIKEDAVDILSAWDAVHSSSSIPKTRKFEVAGFTKSGIYTRDLKYVYINIDDSMKYFSPAKNVPTGLAVLCEDVNDVVAVSSSVKAILDYNNKLKIETWQDRNKKIFYSLKLERLAMLATLFFIILVASFSIIASLVLMVESKKKDFVILLSMGLKSSDLKGILLRIAFIKSSFGALLGGVLGTIFCILLKKYNFITLPNIYYETKLPVDINIWFNITVVLFAILVSLAGTYFPLSIMSRFSLISELRKN